MRTWFSVCVRVMWRGFRGLDIIYDDHLVSVLYILSSPGGLDWRFCFGVSSCPSQVGIA